MILLPQIYSFWSINDCLDIEKLKDQLDQFKQLNFDGVVFQPRDCPCPEYLSNEWMGIVSECILYAKALKMSFYIQDENGFPTGIVSGKFIEKYPHDRCQYLEIADDDYNGHDILMVTDHNGERYRFKVCYGEGLDFISLSACRNFIDMVYERYKEGLSEKAFNYLTGFFSDEPQLPPLCEDINDYGAIPWSGDLPVLYKEKYSENLIEKLPMLFYAEPDAYEFRQRFRNFVSKQMSDSFFGQVNSWCKDNNMIFTGHLKGEETPYFQVPFSGSCNRVFANMELPGIDALERFPQNDFFPRQLTSYCRQFGNGYSLVECFGGSGWGAEPNHLLDYLCWLGRAGVTHYVIHQQQYTFDAASLTDWPPSIPFDLTWKEAFPEIIKSFKENCKTFYKDRKKEALLVVMPQRRILSLYQPWEIGETNIHNGCTFPDTAASRISEKAMGIIEDVAKLGINYDITEEEVIEDKASFQDEKLRLGDVLYERVLVLDDCMWSEKGEAVLAKFKNNGGILLNDIKSISPEQLLPVADKSECIFTRPQQSQWEIKSIPANRFVLEFSQENANVWKSEFKIDSSLASDLECVLLANCKRPLLNDREIIGKKNGQDGISFVIDRNILSNENTIKIEPDEGFRSKQFGELFNSIDQPLLAYLQGEFSVLDSSGYKEGPNGTITTDGDFLLHGNKEVCPGDLVESGYPFCFEPITFINEINLETSVKRLKLSNTFASCAEITIDGHLSIWCFAPSWTVSLEKSLKSGKHTIEVKLVPSTFNFFGPHHHYMGDRHVVSPVQYAYKKNVADLPDAPDNTRSNLCHFKPFGIGEIVAG